MDIVFVKQKEKIVLELDTETARTLWFDMITRAVGEYTQSKHRINMANNKVNAENSDSKVMDILPPRPNQQAENTQLPPSQQVDSKFQEELESVFESRFFRRSRSNDRGPLKAPTTLHKKANSAVHSSVDQSMEGVHTIILECDSSLDVSCSKPELNKVKSIPSLKIPFSNDQSSTNTSQNSPITSPIRFFFGGTKSIPSNTVDAVNSKPSSLVASPKTIDLEKSTSKSMGSLSLKQQQSEKKMDGFMANPPLPPKPTSQQSSPTLADAQLLQESKPKLISVDFKTTQQKYHSRQCCTNL